MWRSREKITFVIARMSLWEFREDNIFMDFSARFSLVDNLYSVLSSFRFAFPFSLDGFALMQKYTWNMLYEIFERDLSIFHECNFLMDFLLLWCGF